MTTDTTQTEETAQIEGLATEDFLKDSFKMIRIQALEQAMMLCKAEIGKSSDPRVLLTLIDNLRKLIKITETGVV